ncbi:hypothetical protein EZ456_04820 [Pedobacter psychrodurus]|uniref:Aspartyl protease n=1 Tax=Pedobacter psychrodurus TaxID=2530456 RepID=A0A4R0Q4T4_9SPHI|nr:hypothetical protein [Pedobacter psychrodurus]TCD28708.1 hypothetical protein EZ456_04820 [Pedobacter psychrodurus]
MKKTFTLLTFLLVYTISNAQNKTEPIIENKFQLTGDTISFPLTIINAFPFISVEVNGTKGKLMFDTGAQGALDINNNIFSQSGRSTGNGNVGSGQKFKRYIIDSVKDIRLANGLHFKDLKQVSSANFEFLQDQVTPDFLGFIGFDFFKGYLFKLDYVKRKITFYKNSSKRELSKDFLFGEKILATLNFETRKLPNHPMIKVKIGDVDVLASFDTGGSYGALEFTDKTIEKLKKRKYFIDYGKDGYGEPLLVLNNVRMNGQLTTNFIGIHQHGESINFRKAIGITEENYLTIANRFLAQYRTVWDYEHKKIYVMAY